MFPSINAVKKLQRDLADEIDAKDSAVPSKAEPMIGISQLLKNFGSSIDDDFPPVPARAARADWSPLIDRIRDTARHVRDVEAQAQARDEETEQTLRRMRDELTEANARALAAEAQISYAEARAAEEIRAAEARASMADERARVSEEWLMRIQEILHAEFSFPAGARG